MARKKVEELLKSLAGDKKLLRIVFFLGIGGILLIYLSTLFPTGDRPAQEQDPEPAAEESEGWQEYQARLEQDLRRVVSAITGEENPEVMVTLENAGRSVYAADARETQQEGSRESQSSHVVLEDEKGGQHGLAVTRMQPEVKGAVIVCRGAGSPALREKLVNAARTVLGISSARVCVVDAAGSAQEN